MLGIRQDSGQQGTSSRGSDRHIAARFALITHRAVQGILTVAGDIHPIAAVMCVVLVLLLLLVDLVCVGVLLILVAVAVMQFTEVSQQTAGRVGVVVVVVGVQGTRRRGQRRHYTHIGFHLVVVLVDNIVVDLVFVLVGIESVLRYVENVAQCRTGRNADVHVFGGRFISLQKK